MHASFINVPLPGSNRRVPAVLYPPSEGKKVVGIVVVAPGSNGGSGPGLERNREGLHLSKSQGSLAFGSIYRRLGFELADAGQSYDWRGNPQTSSHPSCRENNRTAAAVLHISWRHTHGKKKWPGNELKLVSSLEVAANDFVAAVQYARATYGMQLPVVLVGFSFGGPAAWAAAAKLTADAVPPAGVVALAGSGRDGSAFRERGLDTLGCAMRCREAGVSALLVHGTADLNVAVEVSQYFFNHLASTNDSASLALAIVPGSEHIFDMSRDIVFNALKSWILVCLRGKHDASATIPFIADPVGVYLRGGGRVEQFSAKPVWRGFLLRPNTKGYSEKDSRECVGETCNTVEN